jgi:hypothetical protein
MERTSVGEALQPMDQDRGSDPAGKSGCLRGVCSNGGSRDVGHGYPTW